MGDRAIVEIITNDGNLYFYTHWNGFDIYNICQESLEVVERRDRIPPKGGHDDSYAIRIILDELIKKVDSRDSSNGCGISLKPKLKNQEGNFDPKVVIDIPNWNVHLKHVTSCSVDENGYIKL